MSVQVDKNMNLGDGMLLYDDLRGRAESQVVVGNSEPQTSTTKLWVDTDETGEDYEVPTYREFMALNEKVDTLKQAINNPDALKNCVNFIDYDGTVLYSYTAQEAMALRELPLNPVHTGLVSQGWNWTLEAIKRQITEVGGTVWVGQMYVTASGATEMDVVFDDPNYVSPYLHFWLSVNGEVTIDWGDGTEETITNSTAEETRFAQQHVYSSTGNYTVTISVSSGTLKFEETRHTFIFTRNSDGTVLGLYCNCLRNIRVGENIIIGGFAFFNSNCLQTVTLPSGLTSFGDQPFYWTMSLFSITMPDTIQDYGTYTVCVSGIRNISVPYTATEIVDGLVEDCYFLKSITIPYNVTRIGECSIEDCYLLDDITIPKTCTTIADTVFDCDYSLQHIVFPDGITEIAEWTFYECYTLREFVIPNTVKIIGDSAFLGCGSWAGVYIPDGVEEIGKSAFTRCLFTRLVIPSSVISIGKGAFSTNWFLSKVVFLNHPTSISESMFADCSNLHYIELPDTVTSIGATAFLGTGLVDIHIPEGVTEIKQSTFQTCRMLTSIRLSSNIENIGRQAFSFSSALAEIHLERTTPPTLANKDAFAGIDANAKFYVPYSEDHSILNAYKTATNWSYYASKMEEEPQ